MVRIAANRIIFHARVKGFLARILFYLWTCFYVYGDMASDSGSCVSFGWLLDWSVDWLELWGGDSI